MISQQETAESEQAKSEQAKKQPEIKHPLASLLSFEDICPQWNSALAAGFSNNSHLNINDGKYCIVGEAHKFRDSAYICYKCWEYSQSFVSSVYGNELYGYRITDHELFEYLKQNFVEHFNQRHTRKKSIRAILIDKVEKIFKSTKLRYLVDAYYNVRHLKELDSAYFFLRT